MKKLFLIFVFAFGLNACGEIATPQTSVITIVTSTKTQLSPTATRNPLTPTKIADTEVPTLTATPAPIVDSQGNITWHPQAVLITSKTNGGDGSGSFSDPPEFVLLWDGTLLQQGRDYSSPPYISHLDRNEMCKILNTVDSSGFFDESRDYNFPFDGLWGQDISVNAWKSNSSGSQILSSAISGAPYYDGLLCRNCPIPSEETIIQPGLANMYFLLKNYVRENRKIAPVEKLKVYFIPVEDQPTNDWPITSITLSELVKKCNGIYCDYDGVIFDGEVAKEFVKKIKTNQVYKIESFMDSTSFRVSYRPLWPYESLYVYPFSSEKPQSLMPSPDYTQSCNASSGQYPILPLSKENKYWYYAPDGKWGAEVVDKMGELMKIRVVNKLGYEKFYQYDPPLFGQSALKVFPRFWTKDDEYFFVNVLPGDFDAQKTPFVNSIGLQRISISDGKVSYMFAGVENQQYAYSMSDSGGQVAYIRQGEQPLKILIKDTYSNKENSASLVIPLNGMGFYEGAGTLVWSYDKQIIYVATTYNENNVKSGRLIAVEISNPANQKIIYESVNIFKLNQQSILYSTVGICPLDARIEDYCQIRLNLENGIISKN